ncbi:LysR family transcriptional regulator [Azotosporobacter soli]|uniref:LysR family transcriptional regulator n=1 Tax=Azotosporobacter soli TaxID=3055040 RepID=UPI0031FE84F7
MEIRQLRIFAVAARRLSFTKAAEELGYVQSNVTAQIRQLEDELDVKLFDRLGRQIYLTAAGRKFEVHVQHLLQQIQEIGDDMKPGQEIRGKVSIGAAESLCVYRLPSLLREYRRRYPQVELHLEVNSCQNFAGMLRDGSIDVAFSLTQLIRLADMKTTVLIKEPMIVVAHPSHPLAAKSFLVPEDLEGQAFILTEKTCGYRPLVINMLQEANVTTGPMLEFSSIGAIKECVAIGLGVSVMPRIAVEQELEQGRLLELPWRGPHLGIKTQMMLHRDKWLSPALKAFIQLAEELMLGKR